MVEKAKLLEALAYAEDQGERRPPRRSPESERIRRETHAEYEKFLDAFNHSSDQDIGPRDLRASMKS